MKISSFLLLAFFSLISFSKLSAAEPVAASGTLPILHIETENRTPITSKTEYLNASYWLCTEGSVFDALGSEAEPLAMQIRGRGHSSWKAPKKPYKIKFAKKTEVMGMPKNKHFALLKAFEGTVAGMQMGQLLQMAWTPSFRPVEVVLNGDYIGLYFLTETIRIDENRVNIYEQQDRETDPDIVPYGWLVEVDNYVDDCQITVPEGPRWNLRLTYHSPEDLSPLQTQWLTSEFKTINAAIYSADKTSTDWEKYINVESMARFFIIQEVMDNPDGFHGSFYLHKGMGDDAKWVAGPIWDLTCYNRDKTDYTFRMDVHYTITPHWIGEIIQYENFCNQVRKVWNEVYPTRLDEIYERIDSIMLPLGEAWRNDCLRWGDDPTVTAQFRANRIKTALRKNIDWLAANLPQTPYSSAPKISALQSPVRAYNLQGICVGVFEDEAQARAALPSGLYIIASKKVRIE